MQRIHRVPPASKHWQLPRFLKPRQILPLLALLLHHNRLLAFLSRALKGTDATTLTIIVIELFPLPVLYLDRHVRTIEPTKEALDTIFLYKYLPVRPPGTRLKMQCTAGFCDNGTRRDILPSFKFHPSITPS